MTAQIVVIDNDPSMREMFEMCLTGEGWNVSTAGYALLNTAIIHALQPTLIILDLNVTQASAGWNFLQMLKMDPDTAHVPMIVCTTATTLSQEIEGYLFSRQIRIIRKPFDVDALILMISESLSNLDLHQLPILVVEDKEVLRSAIAEVLRLEGYFVMTTANGQLALDAVQQSQFALILLDMIMPVMSGLEFLTIYASMPRTHNPVLIWSDMADHLPTALPAFVMGVLSKTADIDVLLATVAKFAVFA